MRYGSHPMPARSKPEIDLHAKTSIVQPLSNAERDQLFGRLAVHNVFIEQATLDNAIQQQTNTPSASVAEILVQNGYLSTEDRGAIEHLLERHLAKHGNDPQQSSSSLPASSTNSQGAVLSDDTVAFVPKQGNGQYPHKRFGEYELLAEVARGGMGVVYKARQVKLNRLVALKMIRSGELADDEQVKRFYSEAEAAAKLDHPGIVPVYEVGEANGQHFFSMALVVGTSLNDRVKNDGPLAPKEAARLLKAVAEAVEYAHGKGIIHRDIKPQNILLDEAGQPRLTDFGLAKQARGQDELTAMGQVMGTPSYMPPEQASGKLDEIGPASDVYSLGATLYVLLTGRPPFQTASTVETIKQVLETEPVALRRLNPAIPRDLETICLKCLRKEPAKRYATAAELANDLGNWLENKPIVARPVGPVERTWLWCKRRPTLVGMSLLLIVLSAAGTFASWERQNATRARALVETLMATPPPTVPYVLENLSPVRGHAKPILRQRFADESKQASQRLRAAMALAQFGELDVPFLVTSISQAQAGETANIVRALRCDPAASIARLQTQFVNETNPPVRFRLAVVLLQLGETGPARQLLALAPDPSQRTLFIHQLRHWRGDLAVVVESLGATDDPDFQSGLCQALGIIPVAELSRDEVQALEPVLRNLYAESPFGPTHSAARWALRQLKLESPQDVVPGSANAGRDWYVNSNGMTLLKIPAGEFDRKDKAGQGIGTVTLSRAFWLGDCEVTRSQFEAFIADPDCPRAERPAQWRIEEGASPTADCPVINVNWFDAILFCNWLSRREGLMPSYERTGERQKSPGSKEESEVWRCFPHANGYRLPTEAEWEYACRAKSATFYCFGDDESLLSHYAVINSYKSQPVSSRQPNGWGLFDMHGNVWEWNQDWFATLELNAGNPILDPVGPSTGNARVLRGGAFNLHALNARSAYRNSNAPTRSANFHVGFRVARNYTLAP